MSIKSMISEVSHISQKYDLINKKTGGFFNIFDIESISTDEVAICRFIYELINPNGSHYQGYKYLKLFIENVLGLEFNDYQYEKAMVFREYEVKNRRVDLVVGIADKKIPIEVKIYAADQYNQCYDYYKNCARNSNVYYLTLDGREPSNESAGNLEKNKEEGGYKEITQISFEREILIWLEKCISDSETIKIAPIREVILQFIGVVKKMTNSLDNNKEKEIVDLISKSKENMKSAIQIERSLEKSRNNMVKKVLETLEEELDREFKKDYKTETYYKANNYSTVENYYKNAKSTYPSINYFVKTLDEEKEIDLIFRIEIEQRIFVGFCTSQNGKNKGQVLSEEEISNLLNKYLTKFYNWWIDWEYLSNNDKDMTPDFKNFNEAYYDLFDDKSFKVFIENSVKFIKEYYRKNLKK